jgi:hypothetical protein
MRKLIVVLLGLGCGNDSRGDTFAYVSLAKEKKIAVYNVDAATGASASPTQPVKANPAHWLQTRREPCSLLRCARKASWLPFVSTQWRRAVWNRTTQSLWQARPRWIAPDRLPNITSDAHDGSRQF